MDEPKNEEPQRQPYEWVDKMFSRSDDVDPKYRDMLAMTAMLLMGNQPAAHHFYAKAVVDGASDEELRRVVNTAKSANLDVGDLTENVKNAVEEIRREQEQGNEPRDPPPSVN